MYLGRFSILSVFLVFVFASGVWALPEKDPASATVTSNEISRMGHEDLLLLSEKMNTLHVAARELFNRPDVTFDSGIVRQLGDYQTQENVEMLYTLFRVEMRRLRGPPGGNPAFFEAVLTSLERIGTSQPNRYLEEFKALQEELLAILGAHPGAPIMAAKLASVASAMAGRTSTLISLKDHLDSISEKGSAGVVKKLERMQKILESKIIGQPEVVQALMDLEWRTKLYGSARKLPDAIYLLGLPGTGKDTAAEAFADGLNGFSGAHSTHLYKLPVMKRQADLWQLLGSSTGFIGSDNFPPFLDFLVRHSGGKYKVEKEMSSQGKVTFKVLANSEYKGETLEGYATPETAVVFVNEFHNWSRQLKDDFLKQAIEKGYFTINNPNGGLAEIYVPVHFVIASNEGIRLVASREANGQRYGKEMTYEQTLDRWQKNQGNKKVLKNEILATNGSKNDSVSGEGSPGISEELLNRIPDRFILLMRPLSPDDLRKIIGLALAELEKVGKLSELIGPVKFEWDEDVNRVLQEYEYTPEENARPVMNRIISMIEEPLLDAVREGKIENLRGQKLKFSITVNEDQTRTLNIVSTSDVSVEKVIQQPIRYTAKDRKKPVISDARIDQLAELESQLKGVVFGIDPILERLAKRIVSIENESGAQFDRPANLILLTGLSSTGKTETAKQLSQKLSGSNDELITFDFSQMQTLEDFKSKILGLKDRSGNPIPSEFMKYYDRNNGKIVVAFDELANVRDPNLLKSLYDLFRESVVTTFSDGKARPMGGVTIIITGNPGQEMYQAVPRDVPMEVQMAAWQEIAKQTENDLELQRKILEKYFPEPLITRIGRNNIFFVPPHNYKSLRQLAQLKLGQSLKRIASEEGRRGWQVVVSDKEQYSLLINTIIEEGFSLRYQGAAIDSFVRDDLEEPLKSLLLLNKVPSGSKVVLKFNHKTGNDDKDKPGYVFYDVFADNLEQPLSLRIRRPYVDKPVLPNPQAQVLTAFHEAGHSLVRQALFRDAYSSKKISIIPGVGMIGEEWIYYLGIAVSAQNKNLNPTRDWIVRQIAALTAGESAERLVSRGETHSAGKSNDIERATRLARDAIIRYGLSEEWGIHAVPTGVTVEAYTMGLSEKQKDILQSEVQKLIREGRKLGEQTLELNFQSALIPLGLELAEKGEMDSEALDTFYAKHSIKDPLETGVLSRSLSYLGTRMRKLTNPQTDPLAIEMDGSIPKPKAVADLNAISLARKQALYAEVPLPDSLPVGTNDAIERQTAGKTPPTCETLLFKKAN